MGLFSTTTNNIKNVTERVTQNVNMEVHEHRAATDDSVRLLNDFQEKSRENVLGVEKLNNELNAISVSFMDDLMDWVHIHGKFSLNSTEYIFKTKVNRNDYHNSKFDGNYSSNETLKKFIIDKFSEEVSKLMYAKVFRKLI